MKLLLSRSDFWGGLAWLRSPNGLAAIINGHHFSVPEASSVTRLEIDPV
jgi:hypothetical protein